MVTDMAGSPVAIFPVAPFSVARHRPLACLDRTGLENLFESWIGASGRRYVCSVRALEAPPSFEPERAIVAAVRRRTDGASIAFVFAPGGVTEEVDLRAWTQKARACGATEWHVHLLAGSQQERDFAVRDLSPRRFPLAA